MSKRSDEEELRKQSGSAPGVPEEVQQLSVQSTQAIGNPSSIADARVVLKNIALNNVAQISGEGLLIIKSLIDAGLLDMNAKSYHDNTILHLAAAYGNEELACVALAAGVDPNAKNKYGETPMAFARHYGSIMDAGQNPVISVLNDALKSQSAVDKIFDLESGGSGPSMKRVFEEEQWDKDLCGDDGNMEESYG